MIERKKKLKGFTLVELIVVIAVFGLIIAASLSLFSPALRIFQNANDYSASAGMVDNVRRVVEDNLRYANRMDVYVGPDISAGETAFIDSKVGEFRNKFLFGTTDKERVTFGKDNVYVMKINNPETFKDISSTAERPGKVSLWKYDSGVLNGSESKEWAISEGVYQDYSFSLSFGITWDTEMKTIVGREKELIKTGTYTDFGNFVSPSNFRLILDIYENDYNDRANKSTSSYSLLKTNVSNVVALSFVNMASSTTLHTEKIRYIDHTISGDPEATLTPEPTRYTFTNDSFSQDIYIVYTIPDVN